MDAYKYMALVLCLFALVPTVYYFFIFRRIFRTAGIEYTKPIWVCADILFCLVAWHFMSHVTSSVAIFLYLIALTDLIVLIIDFIIRKTTGKTNDEADRHVWKIIFGYCLIPIVVVTAYFIIGSINMRNVRETHYTVTTPKEITDGEYRVCFVSDVHCGVANKTEDYARICSRIEGAHPDIVILGGDMLDFNSEQQDVEEMFTVFGSMKTKDGIYYIFGNHDRTADYKESVFSEEWIIDQCERNGIGVLQDEWLNLNNGINMLGREDATTKYDRIRKPLDELFDGVDVSEFILVADHQPSEYAQLAKHGADLVLGGHLHAGQLFPSSLLLVPFNDEHVNYGRYLIKQDGNNRALADGPAKEGESTATAIISSGLAGWSYPIRTAGCSEYCIIDIVNE